MHLECLTAVGSLTYTSRATIHLSSGQIPDISCMDLRVMAKEAVIQVSLGLHDTFEIICLRLQKHGTLATDSA